MASSQVAAAADPEDLFAPEVIADPYTYFGRLRETDPIHWNARAEMWIVTRHEDIVWLLRHHDLFSSAVIRNDRRPPHPPIDPEDQPRFEQVRAFRSDQLVEHDRPAHQSMRNAVHEYFTPLEMESWRPFVREAVAGLLDEAAPRGRMDVLTALAAPLPVRVITQMMGVPEGDREHLRHLADRLLYINRGEPDRMKPLLEGMQGMIDYVSPKVDERADSPTDDFISVLAQAEKDGVFTRHQVLVNTALLLFAGHETTMNLICNGTLALIRHPDQWARLAEDPAGGARLATEECLRYDPPVKSTQRIAAADVERRGKTIRKGDRIRWIIDVPGASGTYALGPPTVSRGMVFVGTGSGRLVVIADPSIHPAAGWRCSHPDVPAANCVASGFKLVPDPSILAQVQLQGAIMTEPALSRGRVFVATGLFGTDAGTLYMLEP